MAMCVGMAFPLGMFAQTESVSRYEVTDRMQQTIDGFGASDAWSMWQIGEWDDSLQVKVADWLFSKDKGIGLSVWRFNAGAGSASQGDSAQINRDTRTEYFEKQTGQRRFLRLAKEERSAHVLGVLQLASSDSHSEWPRHQYRPWRHSQPS